MFSVTNVQDIRCTCSSFARECHQHTLGASSFDTIDHRLARHEEAITSSAHCHICSAVIRDDHREFTMGCKQSCSTASKFIKGERIRMPRHCTRRIGTFQRVFKEGRITQQSIKRRFMLLQFHLAHIHCHYPYTLFPWRCRYILLRLFYGAIIKVYGGDVGRAALCGHQGYESRSCAYIENAMTLLHLGPCAQQHTVSAHLHGTAVLAYGKLLECKHGTWSDESDYWMRQSAYQPRMRFMNSSRVLA